MSGCASYSIVRKERIYEDSPSHALPLYRLGPRDEISLVFSPVKEKIADAYKLEPGDKIAISFYSNPEMDQTAMVLPDGIIQLSPRGQLHAAGKSIATLSQEIAELFKETIREPLVFVSPVQVKQETEAFISAVNESGNSRMACEVSPDGRLFLPFADTITAAGAEMREVQESIQAIYRSKHLLLSVTAQLTQANNNSVYIFGEVRKPGAYPIDGNLTVSRALAKSGVIMEQARLRSVIVLSHTMDGNAVKRVVNIQKLLRKGNVDYDIPLHQYDVVFVPKTGIARANQFVDQYINGIVPDFIHFTIGPSVFTLDENE